MKLRHAVMCVLLPMATQAFCQVIEVPNASFEQGADKPTGWTLSGGQGRWLEGEAADGRRAIAATGSGEDSSYWRSGPIAFEPSALYRLRFRARNLDGQGGTVISGPVFCNRDLGHIADEWRSYTSLIVTPAQIAPDASWLRFGQWHVKGSVAFDSIELVRALPVYTTQGDLVLGQGEQVSGHDYVFRAPLQSESRSHSRPLAYHACYFNSNRWVFGTDSEVVYRHRVGERRQTTATVEVSVNWYAGGELVVETAPDGKTWRQLGVVAKLGDAAFRVPTQMLPAKDVWVRLRARAKERVGQDSDPGSFQVNAYSYRATLDGEPAELRGATRFIAVPQADPRLRVTIESLGDGLPGGDNVLVARVDNTSKQAIAARPTLTLQSADAAPVAATTEATLAPGQQVLRLPYQVPGTGLYDLAFTLGDASSYRAETSLWVAELYNSSYGRRLPVSTDRVGIWWASSGWKVSDTRPVPQATGEAIIVRAARNEVDAAQLVVRPAAALRGFLARGGALTGPGGATIPAENVEVLRVRYVPITRPTDRTGVVALWPDPLPPFKGPINLAARKNQPLWVRVKVPRDAPAGRYSGKIRLTAKSFHAEVPLQVQVYDFDLPDRMTCTTAFGFSTGNVWRYQKTRDDAQRRQVLDKYWADFSAHHISPYDPAPLDRFKVTWPGAGDWHGGRRDRTTKHAGESSLLLVDDSTTAQTSATYGRTIQIPEQGFRLRFWYKTKQPGQQFIVTLNHNDANGQWMSGRNNDMPVEGNGQWQLFDRTITNFPEGAASVHLRLWAALYKEDGSPTGTVWFDDVSLQDAGTGAELVRGGAFEPLDPNALKPAFDWTAWDRAMERAVGSYHFNSFRLPIVGLGGGTFHARREPSLLGYSEDTPEYKAAFRAYCRQVQEHLRQRGWLDEAFVYWFDEPAPKDYAFVMNGFRKLKEAAPDLRRMLTEQVEPELVGGPNIWCPVSPNYDHEAAEQRRKAGDHFWWYVCCGPKAPYCTLFIDHPATELRVWLWQTWQRKIEGILVWQTNYWTSSAAYPDPDNPQNPYQDPMGWVSGYSTPAGTRRPWGNGDGRFIYPPEAAADAQQQQTVLDGPVDSIRWEMLRDGIEDYEYLTILHRLLKTRGSRLPADERRQYAALLEVPDNITVDMTTFTKDPAPIEARRDAIARAIEKLTNL